MLSSLSQPSSLPLIPPRAPPTTVLLRPCQKCKHSQLARKHTQMHRIHTRSAVVLTQERAFIVFNSLPEKLIFKTLLMEFTHHLCYIQKRGQPKPTAVGSARHPGCDLANEARLTLQLCEGKSDGRRPLETPTRQAPAQRCSKRACGSVTGLP